MLSMLNWSLTEQKGREVWLFYGARHGRELVMKSHLKAMAATDPDFHLRFCFSAPLAEDGDGSEYRHPGRIDVNLLRLQLPIKPYPFYICGPSPMMESLVPALEDWGVRDSHIHFEAFGPASIQRRAASATETLGKTSHRKLKGWRPCRDLRPLGQADALANGHRQLARICRVLRSSRQFRMPCGWLRQLPDDHPGRRSKLSPVAGFRPGARQLPALHVHPQNQRDPGGLDGTIALAAAGPALHRATRPTGGSHADRRLPPASTESRLGWPLSGHSGYDPDH